MTVRGANRFFLPPMLAALLLCAGCGENAHRPSGVIANLQVANELPASFDASAPPHLYPVKMRPQKCIADGEKVALAALAAPAEFPTELPPCKEVLYAGQDTGSVITTDPVEAKPLVARDNPRADGAGYEASLPHQRVTRAAKAAVYRPDGEEPAYAVYRFSLAGYKGAPTMEYTWQRAPSDWGNLWSALSNFEKNTWEWYRGPDDSVLTIPGYEAYTDPETGFCFLVVLLVSTEEAVLRQLSVGESEMRATGGEYLPVPPPAADMEDAFQVTLNRGDRSPPDSVDLSPLCAPVNDQKGWAACTAFAIGDGAYNYELNRIYSPYGWDLNNPFNRVSPKYLYIVSGELQGWPADPRYYRYAGSVVSDLVRYGVATELNAPYDLEYVRRWSASALTDASLLTIEKWNYVACRTERGIRTAKTILANRRMPVVVLMGLDDAFFDYEAGQVWDFAGPERCSHAMCIVGYDDAMQAFRVRNSWGTDWGDDGYVWIAYATFLSLKTHVDCWILEDEYDPAVSLRFLGVQATLPPPRNVQASDGEYESSIRVTWTSSEAATGYVIYRDWEDNKVGQTGAVDWWVDAALADDLEHIYWVRAIDGTEESQLSMSDTGFAR